MKVLVSNYSFNKTAKTITFNDYVAITLENVLLVTNVTDGVTIYLFNDPTLGGTVSSNVLTLEYDTSAMDNTDDLQIWYDDPNATQEVSAINLDIRDLSQTSDAVAIYGSDDGGTTKRIIKTDSGGAIQVDLEVADVTVTSSALPTGASTLAEQQTQTTHLASIEGKDFATQTTLADVETNTDNLAHLHVSDYDTGAGTDNTTAIGLVIPSNSGASPISTTNPLPTKLYLDGAEAAVNAGNSNGNTLRVVIATDQAVLPISDNGGSLTVDGTVAATQSGTWNINNVSGTVSLPTGASTSANQTTIIGHLDGVEGLLTTIDADTSNISTKIDTLAGAVAGSEMQVDIVASLPAGTNYIGKFRPTDGTTDAEVVPLAGYNAQAVAIVDGSGNQITSFGGGTQYADGAARGSATGTLMMGDDGTNIQSVKVDTNGELQIDVLSSALPTGAATAANQATEQTLIGAVNETAPASDTASSGLNGRLQRIAQRITSLIALFPTALTSLGNFKVSIQEATGSTPVSASYTSAQTNTTFLTPTSGKRIVVTGRHCTVDIDTSVAVTARMAFGSPVSTSACLLKHEGLAPGSIYAPPMLAPVKGAVNQSLFVTTTAATDGSVDFVVDYYEE